MGLLRYIGRIFSELFESRVWALIVKEFFQIIRNRQLIFLLLFPPTLQLFIFGFSLSPEVKNIELGIVDYANTRESRELIAAFTENDVFVEANYELSQQAIAQNVREGKVKVGVTIPPDFGRKLLEKQTAEIQVLIDGVNAYTAGIARGYVTQIVNQFNRRLAIDPPSPLVDAQTWFLYNPGLLSSWFFVPGVIGVVLTFTSSLTAAIKSVQEKEKGTLEQLLMTPALTWEILLAKIAPLFLLLMGDVLLSLGVGMVIFGMPFEGNVLLFFALSGLYLFVGIGIGILLATVSANKQQAILTSFFINLPMIQTAGAIAPLESMPTFFQYLSLLNPLRHYIAIVRGILLKGVGLEVLWQNALALVIFGFVFLAISVNKFRAQLS